jgi:uncharacterized RDD family membrane protein YckC
MTETAGAANVHYVGFWKRFIAFLVDSAVVSVVLLPVMLAVYGGGYWDRLSGDTSRLVKLLGEPGIDTISRIVQANDIMNGPGSAIAALNDIRVQLALAVAIVLFWKFRKATPGKMLVRAKIVNARTLGAASTGQLIGRMAAYVVSVIPFCLGFLWIAFDRRKQGWHDKLAGTAVIDASRMR